MSSWAWVAIFGGISVLALAWYGYLGLGLWRRTKTLMADLGRLSQVADGMRQTMEARSAHAPPDR